MSDEQPALSHRPSLLEYSMDDSKECIDLKLKNIMNSVDYSICREIYCPCFGKQLS